VAWDPSDSELWKEDADESNRKDSSVNLPKTTETTSKFFDLPHTCNALHGAISTLKAKHLHSFVILWAQIVT
jgi:hypothetical protein